MGLIRNLVERRDANFGATTAQIPGPLDRIRSAAGPLVTEDSALDVIDVYSNVSIIADAIGMQPLRAFRNRTFVGDDGRTRVYAEKAPRQPQVLIDPMPGDMSPQFNLKHRIVASLLLNGNAFLEIAAVDALGFPSALMPVHPSKIRKASLDDAGRKIYEMHDGQLMGSYRDGGTMVHIPGFIQAGSILGLSPIGAAMQGIGLTMAAEEFGARWFGDGAHPSGYLSNKEDVGEAEAQATKKAWVQTFGGLSREPAYLYGGLEWHPIQINPEESQFIETRVFQSSQMAKLYRVPPHLTGDPTKSTSWGTGIEEQNLAFATFTLGPWVTRIEEATSFLLARGQFAKFNMAALLRGRVKESYEAFSLGRNGGWLSVNDIRETLDMPPIEGGDTYLSPLNMADVEDDEPTEDSPPPASEEDDNGEA